MTKVDIWCVVPAAGIGRRMGGDRPKQYLRIRGRMVIEHTLQRLCSHPAIRAVCIALAPGDDFFAKVEVSSSSGLRRCAGGVERQDSVINGIRALASDGAREQDWVMVHDAVRPCLRAADIDRLVDEGCRHPVGGVLGIPVRDTMKRVNESLDIGETVSRDHLWHAFTPQMFRLAELLKALEGAASDGAMVTDEAQAMERCGARARMVEGHADNIKITTTADLAIAEQYLAAQENGA